MKRENYVAPEMELLELAVEQGFAISDYEEGEDIFPASYEE